MSVCATDIPVQKTEVKTSYYFVNITQVGVSKLFREGATGITKGTSVRVSKVFQEAFIKVDEEGATAGAFTGLFFFTLVHSCISNGTKARNLP